jgi:hypothetical protein
VLRHCLFSLARGFDRIIGALEIRGPLFLEDRRILATVFHVIEALFELALCFGLAWLAATHSRTAAIAKEAQSLCPRAVDVSCRKVLWFTTVSTTNPHFTVCRQ